MQARQRPGSISTAARWATSPSCSARISTSERGIVVDDTLQTVTDPRIYAVGECACVSVHGANRLASNSLLECFVFGEAAARHITANWDGFAEVPAIRPWVSRTIRVGQARAV